MKTIVDNQDGTFTVWDETEDGFFLVIINWLLSPFNRKWHCNVCKREYNKKKEAEECCWVCSICNTPIHGLKPALAHVKKHQRGKNGKEQTGKTI
jgi:hypothetical protein